MVLSIERADGTISGELAVEDQPAYSFFGWLELIAHVERETTERERTRPVSED